MEVLKQNTQDRKNMVQYVKDTGENIPDVQVDYVFSIGVLHHIPNPVPVVKRAYEVLKPGGKFLFWVYGKEGNELYLSIAIPLRKITSVMPDIILHFFAHFLNIFLTGYIFLSLFIPLPLHKYMQEVISKLTWQQRTMNIFDQLNPAYAKYYRQDEVFELMKQGGFKNINIYHRHNYSWTLIGEK